MRMRVSEMLMMKREEKEDDRKDLIHVLVVILPVSSSQHPHTLMSCSAERRQALCPKQAGEERERRRRGQRSVTLKE